MKKKLDLKSMFVGIIAGSLLFGGIVTASTALSNVFLNPYPVYANGSLYNPTSPLLNYQGRTYVPLSEFGTLTNANVRFTNNTIYVDSNNYNYNNNYYNPNYNYPTSNYSELEVEVDDTESFYVNLNKYGARGANITYGTSYIKLSKSYLTYSSSVTVEGRREGNTTIVITYDTGDIEYIYVNVEDNDDEDDYEDEFKLEVGDTDSFYIDLDDYDADKATLSYDDDYIKLSKSTLYSSGKVTITAKEEGDTTIKIKYDTGDVDYIYVEVYEEDDDERYEMEVNNYDSVSFYINLDYYDADKATLSYDSDYVKLSKTTFYSSGKVTITAKEEGYTTIKVKYDTGDIEYIDLEIE